MNRAPPVLEPPFHPTGEARFGGVLLAAGTSSRFGDANKLLATVDGTPVVERAARTYLGVGLDPVVAVVGHEADRVAAVLPDGVETVHNPDYGDGQSSSVRTGIGALDDAGVDAAVVGLGDMPFVRPKTVVLLGRAFRAGAGDPLAAAVDGRRGNPVCFGARWFDDLRDVTGDVGGRELLSHPDAALVETADPGVRRDVDRPRDL